MEGSLQCTWRSMPCTTSAPADRVRSVRRPPRHQSHNFTPSQISVSFRRLRPFSSSRRAAHRPRAVQKDSDKPPNQNCGEVRSDPETSTRDCAESPLNPTPSRAETIGDSKLSLSATNTTATATTTEAEDRKVAASTGAAVAVVLALIAGAAYYKDPIASQVLHFAELVSDLGPLGYVYYIAAYVLMEVLAIPSFPLAWGAVIFGQLQGGCVIVFSATLSATFAFLFSRYIAQDRILPTAEKNPLFSAVNTALGKEPLKVVFLMRLSPVIPGAIANYFYGVTQVKLYPYVVGTAMGEVPGAVASMLAGTIGQSIEGGADVDSFFLGLGAVATVGAIGVISDVAKKELEVQGALAPVKVKVDQKP